MYALKRLDVVTQDGRALAADNFPDVNVRLSLKYLELAERYRIEGNLTLFAGCLANAAKCAEEAANDAW